MPRSEHAFLRGLSIAAVAAFVGTAVAGAAHAATLAVGPVEQVNVKASTLVVLGQIYRVDAGTLIKNQRGQTISIGNVTANTLVVINGTETSAGQATVDSVASLPQLDVPGATPLLVTGVVSEESPTGQIKIGNLTVDIVDTLTSDTPQFQVGNLVEVTGTQPNPGGLFLAQSVTALSGLSGSGADTAVNGLSGSGADTAVNGLSGSGADTAVNGLSGSGADTAVNGLSGSGKR